MSVDTATRPFVYAALEQSGQAVIGHLAARCRGIKGEATWTPRRLQPDPEVDPWPCASCVSLEQLADWERRSPDAGAQGWCRSAGHAAAEILPAELKTVPPAADTLYSGVHHPGNLEDTTMNATINRTNDLTAEILEGLKNAFATAIRYGVEGAADLRAATLKCYQAGELDAALATDLTDRLVAKAAVKAQAEADSKPAQAKPEGPAFEKGMIVTNDAGQIVRLYVSKAGNFYGKVRDEYGTWEYQPGAMRGARHLTADEARAYGVTEERCVFCATKIETKESLAVGYGPDCAEKYGLPWGSK